MAAGSNLTDERAKMLKDVADSFTRGELSLEGLVDNMVTIAGRDNVVEHVDLSSYGINMVNGRQAYQLHCLLYSTRQRVVGSCPIRAAWAFADGSCLYL